MTEPCTIATRVTLSGHPLEIIGWLCVLALAIAYIARRR